MKTKAIGVAASAAGLDDDIARIVSVQLQARDYQGVLQSVLVLYRRRGGEMLNIRIDSAKKQLSLEVQFPDDERPLSVAAGRYSLVRGQDGKESLLLEQVTTSKSSYNVLLKMLPGGTVMVPLPPQYAEVIKLVL